MNELIRIQLGSTFRVSFVSSGAVLQSLFYNIRTGSETLVASYAGVESGNGHAYVDANIDPTSWKSGIYRGQWTALIEGRDYTPAHWLEAYRFDEEKTGRYISWDHVTARYPDFADLGGGIKAASHYITAAEARIDAFLGTHFSVPFSSNNATIRDLTVDMTYLLATRLSNKEYDRQYKFLMETIEQLKLGQMLMITDSGDMMRFSSTGAWINPESQPVFTSPDPLDWEPLGHDD
jgi:phage gp36-like protein